MSLQRQTYLALAILILLGLALGIWVSTLWLILPAFIAVGMITASLFGVCTMTRVISTLPWTESHSGDIRHSP